MVELDVRESIKNIIYKTIGFSLGFGWILIIIISFLLKDYEINILVIILIVLFLIFVYSTYDEIKEIQKKFKNSNKEIESLKKCVEKEKIKLQTEYDIEHKQLREKYKEERNKLVLQYNEKRNNLDNEREHIYNILEEEKIYKPYLANMLADYYAELGYIKARQLEIKKNPAIKASKEIKEITKENHFLKKLLQLTRNQLIVYETLFPWLEEFKEMPEKDINQLVSEDSIEGYERVKYFLSPKEYEELSDSEKYQLWLNRYRNKSNKTNWEIGRDFERYVGYIYENKGYKLVYNGALQGLEDLGRDLIATKNKEILVIQCKNWNKNKVIHEKYIFQLYGTMILKSIEEPSKQIKGVFICTTKLSDTARIVANHLNIEVLENFEFDRNYPCIKCNISRKDGSKIYHLPFDQQYDRVDVEIKKGECYVNSVEEAEKLGFRKAMKHNFFE